MAMTYRSLVDDYRRSADNLPSQVHKAIRDGDYGWLPEIVRDDDPSILWEANSSGWTAVHFAAGHFLPEEWWEWILARARTANAEQFMTARNVVGELVVDIFLRSYFDPLPWQTSSVQHRSRLLKQSIRTISSDHLLVGRLRRSVASPARLGASDNPASVQRCVQFYRSLLLLASAAGYTCSLEFLAASGTCPRPCVDLLLVVDPSAARSGGLLHLWAMSVTYGNSRSWLEALLQAEPHAPTTRDRVTGRFPLQQALCQKSWSDVEPLFHHAPHVLLDPDPVTRLPAAVLAASATLTDERIRIHARQEAAGEKRLVSGWNVWSVARRQAALAKSKLELEAEQVTTIYQVLRTAPQALKR